MKNCKRININGCLYKVVGEMPSEVGACQMAEAYKRQTCATDVSITVSSSDHTKYLVIEKDTDQMITVKCNLCKCQFKLPIKTATTIAKKNDGYIPCEKCDSHATQWDVDLMKG